MTTSEEENNTMSEPLKIENVFVTGATGFVGYHVVHELLVRGLRPVCLVRSAEKLFAQHPEVNAERLIPIVGDLNDRNAMQQAADLSQAAIHLVGIIIARKFQGQSFEKVHVRGTRNVLDAIQQAGINRYLHMSALGARSDAISRYHQTKWEAEECVRDRELQWTIFRPSLIHGPNGEFMQLMKAFACKMIPPMIPYFGSGKARIQPVSVKDVAHCIIESLSRDETIGQIYSLGGPRTYSWIEMYNACRALMPNAKQWKPLTSLPIPVAKMLAAISALPMALAELMIPSVGMFRFDAGQVQMAVEDSVCDHTIAEKTFDMSMRDFEEELSFYADQIP